MCHNAAHQMPSSFTESLLLDWKKKGFNHSTVTRHFPEIHMQLFENKQVNKIWQQLLKYDLLNVSVWMYYSLHLKKLKMLGYVH